MADTVPAQDHAVVLFDGACHLCNGTVQFIIERDPAGRFRFAGLGSPQGQAFLASNGRGGGVEPLSIVLVEDGQVFERSTAALRIARRLNGAWRLLYALILVPRPLRDAIYSIVARHRYGWFGRTDACTVPPRGLETRFL